MTESTINQITCRRCTFALPETEFHKRSRSLRGKTTLCKKCTSAENKTKYQQQKAVTKTAPTEKCCSQCKEIKPIKIFNFKPTTRDGRNTICKTCTNVISTRSNQKRKLIREIATEKYCSYCDLIKPAKEFYVDRGYGDGLSKRCRLCYRATIHLARRCRQFNISIDQYTEMTRAQNGVCAICKRVPLKVHPNGFSIDHCHSTGVVRGLLCNHCNTGLGFFEDNPEALTQAVIYLSQHTNSSSGAGSVTTLSISRLNRA